MTTLAVRTERIDDIPLLVGLMQEMGIAEILDTVIHPHANRGGLSVGTLVIGWLSYVLSAGDHRMSPVETWAGQRVETLSALLGTPVTAGEFSDDRLADVLRALSDAADWAAIEDRLSQRLLAVYALPTGTARFDSSTVSVYQEPAPDGLCQRGHSKDHRPDLAQLKVFLASLDPLGLPLVTTVVDGSRADDPLYVPAIRHVQGLLGSGGNLFVGDAKMGTLATRAVVAASGDTYLVPLADTQYSPGDRAALLAPVYARTQPLQRVLARPTTAGPADDPDAAPRVLAVAYEVTRACSSRGDAPTAAWTERLLVICSPPLARAQHRGLTARLASATAAVRALTPPPKRGQRQWRDRAALAARVTQVLRRYDVLGLLTVEYEAVTEGRPQQPPRFVVTVTPNRAAIRAVRRRLGWRCYATNATVERLPLAQAVWVYRGASAIERNFLRLKGRPLGLRPVYTHRDDHTTGLVHFLSLALRVLTLLEYVVRQRLAATGASVAGLYPGNPKRTTDRPTTERLCEAFAGLTLSLVDLAGRPLRHVTSLSDLQRQILQLVGVSPAFYDRLALPPSPT